MHWMVSGGSNNLKLSLECNRKKKEEREDKIVPGEDIILSCQQI